MSTDRYKFIEANLFDAGYKKGIYDRNGTVNTVKNSLIEDPSERRADMDREARMTNTS